MDVQVPDMFELILGTSCSCSKIMGPKNRNGQETRKLGEAGIAALEAIRYKFLGRSVTPSPGVGAGGRSGTRGCVPRRAPQQPAPLRGDGWMPVPFPPPLPPEAIVSGPRRGRSNAQCLRAFPEQAPHCAHPTNGNFRLSPAVSLQSSALDEFSADFQVIDLAR